VNDRPLRRVRALAKTLNNEQTKIISQTISESKAVEFTKEGAIRLADEAADRLEAAGCPVPRADLYVAMEDSRRAVTEIQRMYDRIGDLIDHAQDTERELRRLVSTDERDEKLVWQSRQMLAKLRSVVADYDRAAKLVERLPVSFRDGDAGEAVIDPEYAEHVEDVRQALLDAKPLQAMLVAAERRQRLAQRRAERDLKEAFLALNAPRSKRVCIQPGCKKEARLDDYCKRHARENGIIVHGKIGAGG
jgi:hypothetical protein